MVKIENNSKTVQKVKIKFAGNDFVECCLEPSESFEAEGFWNGIEVEIR